MSKSFNLEGRRIFRVLVFWEADTGTCVSVATVPSAEPCFGLAGLEGDLGTFGLSSWVTSGSCEPVLVLCLSVGEGSAASLRNCLFLLKNSLPDLTTYDLSESFSIQAASFHVWFFRRGCILTSWPISSSHDGHGRTWPFAFSTLTSLWTAYILLGVEDLTL